VCWKPHAPDGSVFIITRSKVNVLTFKHIDKIPYQTSLDACRGMTVCCHAAGSYGITAFLFFLWKNPEGCLKLIDTE